MSSRQNAAVASLLNVFGVESTTERDSYGFETLVVPVEGTSKTLYVLYQQGYYGVAVDPGDGFTETLQSGVPSSELAALAVLDEYMMTEEV